MSRQVHGAVIQSDNPLCRYNARREEELRDISRVFNLTGFLSTERIVLSRIEIQER